MSIKVLTLYDQSVSTSRREKAIRAYMHGQRLLEVCSYSGNETKICFMDCKKCCYSLSNVEKSTSERLYFTHRPHE